MIKLYMQQIRSSSRIVSIISSINISMMMIISRNSDIMTPSKSSIYLLSKIHCCVIPSLLFCHLRLHLLSRSILRVQYRCLRTWLRASCTILCDDDDGDDDDCDDDDDDDDVDAIINVMIIIVPCFDTYDAESQRILKNLKGIPIISSSGSSKVNSSDVSSSTSVSRSRSDGLSSQAVVDFNSSNLKDSEVQFHDVNSTNLQSQFIVTWLTRCFQSKIESFFQSLTCHAGGILRCRNQRSHTHVRLQQQLAVSSWSEDHL
jgi:hypothetical protein